MNKEKQTTFFKKLKESLPSLCLSAICAWLCTLIIFSASASLSFSTVPDYTRSVSIPLFIAVFFAICAAFFLAQRFLTKKLLPIALIICFAAWGSTSVAEYIGDSNEKAYAALVFALIGLAVIVIAANFMKKENIELPSRDINTPTSFIIVSAAFVLFSALFIYLLGSRTAALCSPCFDMGIFAQMYDRMTETFLPLTTCERGFELSHFAVHFSPALYLLMPFCYIFDATDVLVWAQILLVFSGIFPLWLICKKVGLSNIRSTVISLLFLLYPAMSSGAFYDFHENAFLAPFILWTLYFIHTEKIIPTFIFALGVLTVKEDAAIYVAFIALYLFFSRKKYWQGVAMFAMTIGYFLFASYMLMKGGQGMMLGSRYYNIIGFDGSFIDLLKTLIVNPAVYAAESFTSAKLLYAINMLLPFAMLSLMSKKPSRWLLIAPLFVINLISDYQYQYDLGFQYSFGSGALLAYLAAVNLADLSPVEELAPAAETENESTEVAKETEKEIDKRNKITKLDHYIAKLDNKHYRSLKKERKKNELREWAYEYKQALMRKENIEHFEKTKSLSSVKVNYEKINSSKLFTYGRNSKIRKTKYTFSPMLSSLNRGLIPTVFSLCISLLFGTLQDDSYLQSGKVWLDLMSYLFSIGLGSWWGMTNGKAIIQEDYLEVLNNVALLIRDVKNTIFKEKEKGVISSGN